MPRVIVLDGFDDSRKSTVDALVAAGFDATGFAEEDDVFEGLRQDGADVVLLDVPIDEAIEAAESIRRAEHSSPTLLALLNPDEGKRRPQARAAGIDFCVQRPCPAEELVKHVRRFVR